MSVSQNQNGYWTDRNGQAHQSYSDAQAADEKIGRGSSTSSGGSSGSLVTDYSKYVTAADRAFDDQMLKEAANREAKGLAEPFIVLYKKYESAQNFKKEGKFKEAADNFAFVINSMRDPGHKKLWNYRPLLTVML